MPDPVVDLPTDEPPECDLAEQIGDDEPSQRLWLRSLAPLIAARSHGTDPSGRVQLAHDKMHIALCERVSRICRSDLGTAE